MYEEVLKMSDSDRANFQSLLISNMKSNKMPFSQMTFFTSSTEELRRTDAWYQQVESVTAYLLSQGSSLAFSAMLSELKNGADMDKALGDNYSAKFRSMAELENAWKFTI